MRKLAYWVFYAPVTSFVMVTYQIFIARLYPTRVRSEALKGYPCLLIVSHLWVIFTYSTQKDVAHLSFISGQFVPSPVVLTRHHLFYALMILESREIKLTLGNHQNRKWLTFRDVSAAKHLITFLGKKYNLNIHGNYL